LDNLKEVPCRKFNEGTDLFKEIWNNYDLTFTLR
jgi:hypothetical protein